MPFSLFGQRAHGAQALGQERLARVFGQQGGFLPRGLEAQAVALIGGGIEIFGDGFGDAVWHGADLQPLGLGCKGPVVW
ncbi:MAG: hypothetical protein EBX37_18645 [Alphaproteobacteria bacterium]|nr:hypothetical protein [Alphaproteobacteria bacterium]